METRDGHPCENHRVVVVGGGLAGLSAARLLSSHPDFSDVVVLEAGASLGGRIKQISGLVPWPVEIGPEFLHGKRNSSMKRIVDEMGCHQRELPYPDRIYLGHEKRLLTNEEAEMHPDVQYVHDIFVRIAEEDTTLPDMSVAEYLRKKGVSHSVMQLAQSIYANDFGCSLEQLGVRECIQEAQEWIYGDTYLILDRPLSSVIDHLAQGLNVHLNWPVKTVEYSEAGGVRLTNSEGATIIADYAILTVPVTILQKGLINFIPPLPEQKHKAAKAIGMSNALKVREMACLLSHRDGQVLLAFSNRFWPEDLFDVVCSDCFLPEIWVTKYPPGTPKAGDSPPLGKHVIVGFMAGALAVEAAKLPKEEIFRRAIAQLDEMFGKDGGITEKCPNPPTESRSDVGVIIQPSPNSSGSSRPPKFFSREDLFKSRPQCCEASCTPSSNPASCNFSGGHIVNWSDEVFIQGGYTHPSVDGHGARSTLAEPYLGRLFFGGEATHPGVNPCMQAAIDTGMRAAYQVMTTLTPSRL